jgi:hypothetical protein
MRMGQGEENSCLPVFISKLLRMLSTRHTFFKSALYSAFVEHAPLLSDAVPQRKLGCDRMGQRRHHGNKGLGVGLSPG